jgi:hypothetical protein
MGNVSSQVVESGDVSSSDITALPVDTKVEGIGSYPICRQHDSSLLGGAVCWSAAKGEQFRPDSK